VTENSKIVFFDIDGTLWDSSNIIPQSAKEAIKRLQENGHRAYINSGRTRGFIRSRELLDIGFDGIVCGCGTMIEMGSDIKYLYEIPKPQVEETLNVLRKNDVHAILEGRRYLYFDVDYFKSQKKGEKILNDMCEDARSIDEEWGRWEISKMSCVMTSEESLQNLRSALSSDYTFMTHSMEISELVPIGFNKGTGIQKVCELTGTDISDTFAFGDSINDVDMMRTAGVSIAMGNGTDEIKRMCDMVTDSLYDDGIYNACKKIGLI